MKQKLLVKSGLLLTAVVTCAVYASGLEAATVTALHRKIELLERQTNDLMARIKQLEKLGVASGAVLKPVASVASAAQHSKPSQKGAETTQEVGATESPVSADAVYKKITKLIERKEYNQAEKLGLSYIDQYPDDKQIGAVYFWLGEIKMLFGDLAHAKSYYQKALAQPVAQKRIPEVLLKMSVICYQTSAADEGDVYFNQLREKYPQSTAFHMAKAQRSKYRVTPSH